MKYNIYAKDTRSSLVRVTCRWSPNTGRASVCCRHQRHLYRPDSAAAERRSSAVTPRHRHSAHRLRRHQRHRADAQRLED